MFRDHWMGISRTAVAAAVAVVVAAPALAQNTTASVNGRVTGADGKPVAAATIKVVHVESGSANTVQTDSEGRYTVRGLRAGGPYTITITDKAGQVDKREGVFLQLADATTVNGLLGVPAATVVVTGRGISDKFNSANMGSGTNIGARELASLASIQRNLQDYARTDPRISQTDKERGQISAAGQNVRYNSITIDGVTTNDTFGLNDNNLPTKKQPISIDAIQSVQVNLSNYDVTQKGYTGANINAVTKSGTNELHGSVYYVWRDESLTGKRYTRQTDTYTDVPVFTEDTKGFTLGGPIIQDRLFFFASYEEFKSSRTSPTVGPVGSAQTNVGINASALTEAIGIAKNTWGVDVGTPTVPTGLALSVKDTLLKLDWNISDAHRANLRYTKTQQSEPNLVGFGATGLSLSSYWYNQVTNVESVVGQWFADWAPNFSTEFKVSKRDFDSEPLPVNGARLPQVVLRFTGSLPPDAPAGTATGNRDLSMGTERSRHFNVLETKTVDAYFGGTLTLGAHELKFGGDYSKNDIFNAFLQDANGQYRFQCENGTYSFGTVTCNTASAADVQAAVMENFRLGNPSFYQAALPLAGRTLADAAASWSYGNTGLLVQDTWKVSPSLSLMFGVRVDQQSVPGKPLANSVAAQPRVAGSVVGNVVTRDSGGFGMDNTTTLDGNNLVQPRFGFNWNLGGNDTRMQVRGGFGLFQGAAANVWLSNPFSNTGRAVTTLSCSTFSACNTAGADFNPDPSKQPVLVGTPPAATLDILSPNLEQPSVWKANVAFETELPELPVVGRLVAGAEYMYTKTKSGIYYKHLNLGDPTKQGSDGRDLFYTPQGYLAGCWTGGTNPTTSGATCTGLRARALSNPNFSNTTFNQGVFLAEKTSLGSGDALTLSISRPLSAGFGWSLSYTRTTADDVSPLTSSTAGSNWANRNVFNPNEEVASPSNYVIKDRFNASMSWAKAFVGSYRTSVGVFYEGRRGRPYSWTYINDLNGDGNNGNDLMYIPTAPGSGEVVFRGRNATETAEQAEAAFWGVVNANPGLASAKGGLVGRNNNYAPWVNNFDVRVSQELPGFAKSHKTSLTFDILNFGNMLNKKWGRIDEIGFPSNRSFVNYNGLDANGKYIYSMGTTEDLVTRNASNESQWAVQVTLRYEF